MPKSVEFLIGKISVLNISKQSIYFHFGLVPLQCDRASRGYLIVLGFVPASSKLPFTRLLQAKTGPWFELGLMGKAFSGNAWVIHDVVFLVNNQ